MPRPSLTIVIPAYNEARRLPPSLERIVAWVRTHPELAVDVLLVDDGSTDGTAEAARQAVGDRLPLTILRNEPNRGKGYSVRRGMLAAQGAVALFSDADLSTPIEEADRLLAAINDGADIAIGSRGLRESNIKVHQPWWRESAGRLFGVLTRLVALPGIRDSQCGFKAFRREAAQAVFSRQSLDGWAFDVELLVIARKLGYRIVEVPVHWENSPDSKVQMLRDGPGMLRDLLRVRWRHRGREPS